VARERLTHAQALTAYDTFTATVSAAGHHAATELLAGARQSDDRRLPVHDYRGRPPPADDPTPNRLRQDEDPRALDPAPTRDDTGQTVTPKCQHHG